MIPTEKESQIINLLINSKVSEYDKLIKQFKTYNLSYDLTTFIKTLKEYPIKFGEGNPKCYSGDVSILQKLSLKLALCKIPSFYKIGYIGMNIAMMFESISYYKQHKDKLDELFQYYGSYDPGEDKEIRPIEKACFNTASVSDICVPIFCSLGNNDFKLFKEYLPYAFDAYSKLDNGHKDHFLKKLLDALKVMKNDKRDISKGIKVFKKSFNGEEYDIEKCVNYKIILDEETDKNSHLELKNITGRHIDTLQKMLDLKLPYYIRVDYIDILITILKFFHPYFDTQRDELLEMRKTTPRFFIYKETKDQGEKVHAGEN